MRPTILHVGGVLYWTIQTRNPDTMVLKDADSTPSVAVRKNGAAVGDSVTITKRSATTGIYDCSYNPAAEVEGDTFQFEESAAVTGTTTSSATYVNQFSVRVRALERGTDGALQPTVAGRTLNVNTDGEGDAELNTTARVKLDASQPDYAPATVTGLSALTTKIRKYFQLSLRKDAAIATDNATELTEINANGGSGGGTYLSTTDSQEAIRDAIPNFVSSIIFLPPPVLTPVGMPETLEIGDSYDEDAALTIYIRDENDDPVSAAVGHDFTDGDFAPTFVIAPTPGSPRGRVKGTVTYVVPGGSDEPYLKVEIPSSQTKLAVAGEASVQLVLKWPGAEKTLLNTTVIWLPRI